VKNERVSIKLEIELETKTKTDPGIMPETKVKTEPGIKPELQTTTKRKRELNIDAGGVEFVEVREVGKRVKRVRIDEGEIVKLDQSFVVL
jgi:hypothetical protein